MNTLDASPDDTTCTVSKILAKRSESRLPESPAGALGRIGATVLSHQEPRRDRRRRHDRDKTEKLADRVRLYAAHGIDPLLSPGRRHQQRLDTIQATVLNVKVRSSTRRPPRARNTTERRTGHRLRSSEYQSAEDDEKPARVESVHHPPCPTGGAMPSSYLAKRKIGCEIYYSRPDRVPAIP